MKKSRGRLYFEVVSTITILILAVISLIPASQAHQKMQLDHGRLSYVGTVFEHKFTGKGALKFKNHDRYVGQFKDGRFEGTGQFVSHTGWQLKGTFKNGEPTGKVQLRVGNKRYAQKISGDGKLTDAN